MSNVKRLAVAAIALMGVVATAAPAHADDQPHTFSRYWTGGCIVGYRMTPDYEASWGTPTVEGLTRIGLITGITFARDETAGFLRYTIDESISDTTATTPTGLVSGIAKTDGSVRLISKARIDAMLGSRVGVDSTYLRYLDQRLPVHESLHALGLAHDPDTSTTEILNPVMTPKHYRFGPSDLAGMRFLAEKNGCTPLVTEDTFDTEWREAHKPVAPPAPEPLIRYKSKTKKDCTARQRFWSATDKACYSRPV